MKQQVLVVAAHPDDEVLGCGGTVARHAQSGDEVHVLILAEGVTSRDSTRNRAQRSEELSQLAQVARDANHVLGVASVTLEAFPDNRMDSVDRLDVIKSIERMIDKHRPTLIYTHHAGDVNIDHRCIHDAVVAAARPLPSHCVKQLLFFEIASSTEWQVPGAAPPFLPNWYVNIDATLALKLKAMQVYGSELRTWPHPRSLTALEHQARWRGASVGCEAAEAFMLGRYVFF